MFQLLSVILLWVMPISLYAKSPINNTPVVINESGIRAILFEDKNTQVIAMRLLLRRAGSVQDRQGQLGLANLTASLIDEGAGDLNSEKFNAQLKKYSIKMSFNTGHNNISGQLATLRKYKDIAFTMLADALINPHFDNDAVERMKALSLRRIRRSESNISDIAGLKLWQEIFGKHPYGQRISGNQDSIDNITRQDIRAYHQKAFAKNNLMIAVSGNITADELRHFIKNGLSKLPNQHQLDDIPTIGDVDWGRLVHHDYDAPQTQILFAQKGVAYEDKDYLPAFVLNHMIGGRGFQSRLFQAVREKNALAYSVGTQNHTLEKFPLWLGWTSVANENKQRAIDEIKKQWRLLKQQGITQAELQSAKDYLTGSFTLRFTNSAGTARVLLEMLRYDLPLDCITTCPAMVQAITRDDITRVINKYINEQELLFLAVGKK